MIEFTSEEGGRHTYIDDFIHLQNLALAFSSIFGDCDNFIISGCQREGEGISAGYVYINGKIRKFAGTDKITVWPAFIYEKNSVEYVAYADMGDKVGRNVYGCALSSKIPEVVDPLTQKIPQYISFEKDGTTARLEEAFFGKYALLVDSPYNKQVTHDVTFQQNVSALNFLAKSKLAVEGDTQNAEICYDVNNELVLRSYHETLGDCKLTMSKNEGFRFYIDDVVICHINKDGIVFSHPVQAPSATIGSISLKDNHLFESHTSTNEGVLNINMVGYKGEATYARNTFFGDGKNHVVMAINGGGKTMDLNGSFKVVSARTYPIAIQHDALSQSDMTLQSAIQWSDRDDVEIASVGFLNIGNYDFYINNQLGNVRITSNTYIDGTLLVNGVDVMKTLIGNAEISEALKDKVKIDQVYLKEESDKRYMRKNADINTLVENCGGGEIGKQTICQTIGAVRTEDLPEYVTPKDTGWVDFTGQGVVGKARQIGHTVCVTGYAPGPGTGGGECPFTLPSNIQYPEYPYQSMCGDAGQFIQIALPSRETGGTYAIAGTYFNVTYLV